MEGWGGYYGQTSLHPLALLTVLILGFSVIMLPRCYGIVPMLILGCSVPAAQRLVVFGADFDLLRILVLFAWARLTMRNEFRGFIWNRLDSTIVAWKISGVVVYTLAYGSVSAFVNRCGWLFDGMGMYFFFRCMLREWKDLEFLLRTFVFISVPVALAFCVEWSTGRNVFAFLGGVPQFTVVREGRLRCQGAYAHAILAGCFWASAMPWMVALIATGRKWSAGVGVVAALTIIGTCSSSTPILALGFMLLGMLLYFMRGKLREIRWCFFLLVMALQLVMNQPVWHLLARVNVVGGSTGWHRFKIMDATIRNFSEWWLLGEIDPMSWGVWEMRDITNEYILEALRGGLLTLSLFVAAIAIAFGLVGKAMKRCEDSSSRGLMVWSVGVALFVHVNVFFSVSYFGQIVMLVYLTFAMAGSLPTILSRDTTDVESEEIIIPKGHSPRDGISQGWFGPVER